MEALWRYAGACSSLMKCICAPCAAGRHCGVHVHRRHRHCAAGTALAVVSTVCCYACSSWPLGMLASAMLLVLLGRRPTLLLYPPTAKLTSRSFAFVPCRYEQYITYGGAVLQVFQMYRLVVLPVANTWMSWRCGGQWGGTAWQGWSTLGKLWGT